MSCFSSFVVNAALLINGDFDEVSHDYQGISQNRYLDELSGSENWDIFEEIPGWSVLTGSGVEVLHTGANTGGQAGSADDVQAQTQNLFIELDLDQSDNLNHNSAIGQTMSGLILGSLYEISFYYQPRTANENDNGINVHLFDGDLDSTFDNTQDIIYSVDFNTLDWQELLGWELFATQFVATDEEMTLAFSGFGTSNGQGGFLDSVDVKAVPEPSVLALMLCGLFGLAFRKKVS